MRTDAEPRSYVLGHSEQELARLERQAQIFGAETRDLLRRAGIATGMRVLDVGCGAGDVSMIAAQEVGPTGKVLGIDNAAAALAAAGARAQRAGYDWLDFAEADLDQFESADGFDAIIGRLVLAHLPDPASALKRLSRSLNDDGVIAFIEMDIDETSAVPGAPLLKQCIGWIVATYRRVGVEPNMGSRLYATFRSAGLDPNLAGITRIEGGAGSIAHLFAAQTLASLLPVMEKFGIATAEEIGIDTIADRLHAVAVDGDRCIFMPRLIGAWASKPLVG